MTAHQRLALQRLRERGTLTQSEAAVLLFTSRAGATRIMDGLVHKGLAVRTDADAPGATTTTSLRAWRLAS